MPIPTVPLSPRLATLVQELEAGNPRALDAFWHEVALHGAPLIEPPPGDEPHLLVTFLWHAETPIENVAIVGGLAGADIPSNQMTRLRDTNLWYRTYQAPPGVRTTYLLAPNDSLIPLAEVAPEDIVTRIATFRPDPLNPHTFVLSADDEPTTQALVVSVLELPGAAPQPWITPRAGTPAGHVERHRFHSQILDNDRRVWVYTPPAYAPHGPPYGLVLVLDGEAYLRQVPTAVILDNLTAAGVIPPVVAVLIGNVDGASRNRELVCSAPFTEFLVQEVLPWARAHWHISEDPAATIVAGSSLGGLAAGFAGLCHPAVFGNVLSQSGSFWWAPAGDPEHEWLARQVVARPTVPVRWYLDVGRLERGATPGYGPDQVVVNRHLRNILWAKGYWVHYAEFDGGHDAICWRGTLADGLIALLRNDNGGP